MAPPKWKTEQVPSHKFEFIHIPDFHSDSAWAHLRYSWVWIMFFKAILVLCGDIWTCTILIISGSWTSAIKPTIDLSIARWVYSACILLSFVLLAFDFRKANKVIKSQDISYAVSNQIVSGFYCLQKFDYFCFIEKIRNSSKLHDKLAFFVFFQLKGWKHLVVQAPRQVINIMTLIAFMKALGFNFGHLDDIGHLLPSVKSADKFTFCVMVFTSLMFIFSGVTTLIAVMLWVPLVAKVRGNLKEYVCHKMDKRIDAIIKKTTKERAKKTKKLEEKQERSMAESSRGGSYDGRGGQGGRGGNGGALGSSRLAHSLLSKKSPSLAASPRRPKPTLPNIDVILANTSEDKRLQARAHYTAQRSNDQSPLHQHREIQHLPPLQPQQPLYHVQHSQFQQIHEQQQLQQYQPRGTSPYDNHSTSRQTSQKSFNNSSVPSLAQYGSSHSLHYQSQSRHSDYNAPSPPQNTRNLPQRQASMVSAVSYRTDESSPILYPRAVGPRGSQTAGSSSTLIAEGRNHPNQQQAARFYIQQQQFQQIYQQKQHQEQQNHQRQYPSPPSQLQPVQSQQYHDSNSHATAMSAVAAAPTSHRAHTSEHPENWSSHYGFAADESSSETPTTSEHYTICRPDSGVLPDSMDPYYIRMTSASGSRQGGLDSVDEADDDRSYHSRQDGVGFRRDETTSKTETRMLASMVSMMDRRDSNSSSLFGKNSKIYQPDKTELDHYDSLYKDTVTDTHLRVKASRALSLRSKSSKASLQSVSLEPSYVMAMRKQQQEQQEYQQKQQQRCISQGRRERQSEDGPSRIMTTSVSAQDFAQSTNAQLLAHSPLPTLDSVQHDHVPNRYDDPDRPLSVLDPPSALFMGHSRTPSSSSLPSSTSFSVRPLTDSSITPLGSHSSPPSFDQHSAAPPSPTTVDSASKAEARSSSAASSRTGDRQLQHGFNRYHPNGSSTLSLADSLTTSSPRVSMDHLRTLSSTTLQYLRPYSPRQSVEMTRPYPTPPLPSTPPLQQSEGKMELNDDECSRNAAVAVAISAAETGGSLCIEDVLQDLMSPGHEQALFSRGPNVTLRSQVYNHPYQQQQQQYQHLPPFTSRIETTAPRFSTDSRHCSPTITPSKHQESDDYFFSGQEDMNVKVEVETHSTLKIEVNSCSESTVKVEVDSYSRSSFERETRPSLDIASPAFAFPPPPPLPILPMPSFHSRPSSPPLPPSIDLDAAKGLLGSSHDLSNGLDNSIDQGSEEDENEWEEEKLGTMFKPRMSKRSTVLSKDGLVEPEGPATTNPYADFSRSNSPELKSRSLIPESTTVVLSAPISIANLASTLRASMDVERG